MTLFGGLPAKKIPLPTSDTDDRRPARKIISRHRPDSDRLAKLRAEHNALVSRVETLYSKQARTDTAVSNLESGADEQEKFNTGTKQEVAALKTLTAAAGHDITTWPVQPVTPLECYDGDDYICPIHRNKHQLDRMEDDGE